MWTLIIIILKHLPLLMNCIYIWKNSQKETVSSAALNENQYAIDNYNNMVKDFMKQMKHTVEKKYIVNRRLKKKI